MAATPETTLDPRYSSPDATATTWAEARELLERAELFWITTVRRAGASEPDGPAQAVA